MPTQPPSTAPQSGVLALIVMLAVLWPPLYSFYIHPHLTSPADGTHPSAAELGRLLGARRYSIRIPPECDGWLLEVQTVTDGVSEASGSIGVTGGTEVTVVVRRLLKTDEVEYCCFNEMQYLHAVVADPLTRANMPEHRSESSIVSGDWLMRGSGKELQVYPPNGPAEFGVRVRLIASDDNSQDSPAPDHNPLPSLAPDESA